MRKTEEGLFSLMKRSYRSTEKEWFALRVERWTVKSSVQCCAVSTASDHTKARLGSAADLHREPLSCQIASV